MILLNHGVVSISQTSSIEIIESVVARTNIVSTSTKSVTIDFSVPQQKDEVLLFLLYQDHTSTILNESTPANLTTLANMPVNDVSFYGHAKYAAYKREYLLSESTNVEDATFTFLYNDANTNGLLTVRGYRLINADYNNITLATRSLQTNVTSQVIPSSPLNVSKGDATFVQHMISSSVITTSISSGYVSGVSMFTSGSEYRARSWNKIHTTNNASHNATITWNSTSQNSVGFMIHVPHI